MSDLQNILRLAGVRLDEIFAENPRVNDKIEDALSVFPKDQQTRILSAMEALKHAGQDGLTVREWLTRYQQYQDLDGTTEDGNPTDVLKAVAKGFPFAIKRVGEGRYAWVEEEAPDMAQEPEGMDGRVKNAIDQQVGLTYTALEAMRQMKTFTASDLAMWFNKRGFDPEQAHGLADHMLNQFRGMLSVHGDIYTMQEEPAHTNADSMAMFKSFADNPRNPDA